MRRIARLTILVALLLLAGGLFAQSGEVLDRIIVIVNSDPVLLSDWDEGLRCEALLAGRAPESYSVSEQQGVFERLVDQELLKQQMRSYLLPPVSDADLQLRDREVRKQLIGVGDDAQWKALLERTGITESELTDRLRRQMEIERFVDVRFRPGIRIDDRSVTKYYRERFLPELHKAGQPGVPLNEVSGKIREILTQQSVDEQLSAWIQTLREQAEIRIPSADVNSSAMEATQNK